MKKHFFLQDEGADFSVHYLNYKPHMLYTHIHPQYELYFCPEFRDQRSVINGKEYMHNHPCVIIATPYTLHSMCYLENSFTPYESFVFNFGEKTLAAFDDRIISKDRIKSEYGMFFELDVRTAAVLKQIAEKINNRDSSVTEREIYFALFLNKLFAFCTDHKITQSNTEGSYLQNVMKYIAENLNSSIDSDFIAKKFSVSRSKLDRDFKRAGCTPREFIDSCRINLAKLLLERENLSVSEISEVCGFSSETYFYPFFKKHTGDSPGKYRKKVKEDN